MTKATETQMGSELAPQDSQATYSYWRVWPDGDGLRVARDWHDAPPPAARLQPQHLEVRGDCLVVWVPHDQGAAIPSVPLSAFVAWLDQGGAQE